ncbi:MAG: hypothetical protein GC178_14825 [Flavobacteriales bacterium]|nr:hypothetical protein [Flavobacteriales bacterium]
MQWPSGYTEVRALIQLLDDPDDSVYQNVSDRLVSYGKNVIPHLEFEWETSAHLAIQNRIEEIIQQIEFDSCKIALADWIGNGSEDLYEGAVTASMFQYPDQHIDFMASRLELLRKDVWIELNDHLTSLEKIRVLNHILYEIHRFHGYPKYPNSYPSYFISNVLEQLNGSPTALGILYKVIADRLELPVVGIDLPQHFILGYLDVNNAADGDVLFYINPFSKGAVFGKGELERYIEKMQLEVTVESLKPMTNKEIIKRLLTELKAAYKRLGKYRKLDQVDQLLALF